MKFFLSHSSSDKKSYVEYIANKLGDRAVIDAFDFESGMRTLDEIYRTMEASDIFVLFISNQALNSDWVKLEISNGRRLTSEDSLRRFLPILIDPSVHHSDPRIPTWISQHYNLRLVSRPAVALRRLNTVFAQLSLSKHPLLEKRKQLFVGRNSELSTVEQRLDDYSKAVPVTIMASGFREVGRKSLLIQALKKSNKIDRYYNPITLTLQPEDGIEGLIAKIYDIGFYTKDIDIDSVGSSSLEEKKKVLVDLLHELAMQNEIVLIDDWRSVVRYGGDVADWFIEVCERLPRNRVIVAMASASRPKFSQLRDVESIFSVKLSELNPEERLGLLVRYLRDVEGRHDIEPADFEAFKSVLNGYPEQAIYAGQLIAEVGLQGAVARLNDIVQFSSLKASVYVDKFRDDEEKSDLLVFLSWFEFVSLEMISFISKTADIDLLSIVDEFVQDSVCDLIGTMGEYVRLNDIVRDYVLRGSLEIPPKYARALKEISKEIFSSGDFSEYDYSEKYAAVRMSLLEG